MCFLARMRVCFIYGVGPDGTQTTWPERRKRTNICKRKWKRPCTTFKTCKITYPSLAISPSPQVSHSRFLLFLLNTTTQHYLLYNKKSSCRLLLFGFFFHHSKRFFLFFCLPIRSYTHFMFNICIIHRCPYTNSVTTAQVRFYFI